MTRRLVKAAAYALLAVTAVVTIAPLAWMLAASFMPTGQASTFPPSFIPRPPTLDQYVQLFTRLNVSRYLINSVLLSVSVTAISLIVNSMAGYAFAKYRFKGRPLSSSSSSPPWSSPPRSRCCRSFSCSTGWA
jgi:multiple sugar transport system permease protein